MKAIAITPGAPGAELIEFQEPEIKSPTQVKLQVLEVGICGTDREEVTGGRANAPQGSGHLVIGHEMLGRVIETGSEVSAVRPGDFAVFTVRRGCGKCEACLNRRSDLCYTGDYTERGIKSRHGFETEFVVDDAQYVIKVPESASSIGVLAEPMSVAQKAIDEAIKIQLARLGKIADEEWMAGKKVIVAGIGAIGLLAALALRLRGAEVTGVDIVEEDSRRPSILKRLGGSYLNAKKVAITDLDDRLGQVDFIFEAAGVPQLGFDLIDALGINGVYVMTGIPGEGKPVCIPGSDTMAQMVLKNQIILGSVNASTLHFEMGIKDLERAKNRWGNLVDELITTRIHFDNFEKALDFRSSDDIKTVITWK
ncbi:alcohol dehydrogenase [Mucilaginibacter limnophilus]|uniref:Alcohol dehydrogenase n=1 Tax=Mucilaginibacter limnophilus TaxID=1932778 RepID=A0A3S3TF67_9SPHI|nr:glucose 1-dehydrogenase [Mucilaginibacter limnophilus]RVT98425.1 alcohol dehydrogenase [Mucilaginibacter limnophilus]